MGVGAAVRQQSVATRARCAVGVRVGGRHRKVVKGGGRLGGRCSGFRVSGERDRRLGLV